MKCKVNNIEKGSLGFADCKTGDFIVFTDKETKKIIDITMISLVDHENVDEFLEKGERFKLVTLGKQSEVCRGDFESIEELVEAYVKAWDDLDYRIIKSNKMLLTEIDAMEGDI